MYETAKSESPIMDVQRYLRLISTVYPTVPQVAADGIYGPQTTLAVREFQRANDREPNGIVDYDTWELLRLTYDIIKTLNSVPIPGVNFPSDYRVGTSNGSDDYAQYVAIMMGRISSMYENIPTVLPGSPYSENTAGSVSKFQQAAGLEPTGQVDKITWCRLAQVYAAYA